MKQFIFFLIMFSAAVLINGCWTYPCESTGGMEIAQSENGQPYQCVDDPCFQDWLSVEDASVKRGALDMLIAQLVIRNVKKDYYDDNREDDFTAQYKITWFDGNGIAINPDESLWHRITWHGGESVPIKETAPTPAATRYVIRLRHAR